jgi:hypothetical protein
MKKILWVDVVERDQETDNEEVIINSYPFPNVDISTITFCCSIQELRDLIDEMDDDIMKECYHTRLHFIMTRWHPKNFVNVELKDWKYED